MSERIKQFLEKLKAVDSLVQEKFEERGKERNDVDFDIIEFANWSGPPWACSFVSIICNKVLRVKSMLFRHKEDQLVYVDELVDIINYCRFEAAIALYRMSKK